MHGYMAGVITDGIKILPLAVPPLGEQGAEARYARTLGIESWNGDGKVVIAETYPAECYGWFEATLRSKRDRGERKTFGVSLISWANAQGVKLDDRLCKDIREGFPQGDDAFDAVVGLFGMLQVCLGERQPVEPNEPIIREIEGWILGRESERYHCRS